ncbi:MAG: UDP-N-acetylmuramoyl-L-alanyl-D-glutamate--2,6-diaminopimelate ligase [Actinomycetota bacterium]|nr:UDP-N-acetylmuramoyl-L-alanyl-D-glutamate--2,6-diaminopimelate ligase [Actinomycetota bacterium]
MSGSISPKTLAGLVASAGIDAHIQGSPTTQVADIAYDSRSVDPGALFLCVPGARTDGHVHASDAARSGAAALVVERSVDVDLPSIVVPDVRAAMGDLAAAFFDHPAERLLIAGVTGTNGKTTTAYLLAAIMQEEGLAPGLIGTIETRVGGRARPGARTTPESVDLQRLFAEMIAAGAKAVAMEVTSHALVLGRVNGIRFQAAGFTNLTQDHLDFHADMEDYFAAKRSLFVAGRTEKAAVNADDPYGRRLLGEVGIPAVSFGTGDAEVRARDISFLPSQSAFSIVTPKGDIAVRTSLIGGFNVSNCLAATAIALQCGITLTAIERGLASVVSVPGRFEAIDEGQPFSVVVDYAHTPDSLDNVLQAARGAVREGRVICVFGCGGDRDRAKRPLMGAVVARTADICVVTSDNPRSEDPEVIIGEILEGVRAERAEGPDYHDVDRRVAIEVALGWARPGDVVVIAGKGHETGQQFADVTVPFDDRVVAHEVLASLGFGKDSRV